MNNRSPDIQVLRADQMIGPLLGVFASRNGREWTRVNTEPVQGTLEDAIAKLSLEHAIRSPNEWMKIIDQRTGHILHDEAPEVPHEGIRDHFPKVTTDEQLRKRDEWCERVLEWCVPESYRRFLATINDPEKRSRVAKKWLARNKIEVQTHESGAQRVMRDGEPIAEWLV